MSCILVFDIGTTSLKTAVFNLQGHVESSVSKSYDTRYPEPGYAEQNPEDFWAAAPAGTNQLISEGKLDPKTVLSIGLTGHMNGALPVDRHGSPTHSELIHSDSRSTAECREILSGISQEEIYRRTGNRADEHLSLAKILWLRNNRKTVYDKTAYFLNSKDYLRFRLTGVPGQTDYSDGSLTGSLDIMKRQWDAELLRNLNLDPGRFPELKNGSDQAGSLTSEAAQIFGLPSGVPVSVGGGDAACSTRGAGVKDTHDAYASISSSAWVSTLAEHPVLDPGMRMQNFYDLEGEKCNFCGTVQSAGIAVDWIQQILTNSRSAASAQYRDFEQTLAQVPPGSDGVIFLPYLMGERTPHWDASSRGAFIGFSLYHGREAMARSVYEGVAYALRDILSIYSELGFSIEEFSLLGGGVRSPFWRGVICNVIGIPVRLHTYSTHAAALGAALAAGVSIGVWENLDAAVSAVDYTEEITPDAEEHARYDALFPVYRKAYQQLKPLYEDIAHVREASKRKQQGAGAD